MSAINIEHSLSIIKRAVTQYSPTVILVGFSGGNDSLTVFHLLRELGIRYKAFHCNTGIGVEETRVFVRATCKKFNIELIEMLPPYKTYEEMVLESGFPGAYGHQQMWSNLKEKSIRKICRMFIGNKLIVTGVRSTESTRRKVNVTNEIEKRGRQIWVNPIIKWIEDDCENYLERFDTNPVCEILGMSGECLCGAFASRGEFQKISEFYPAVFNQIKQIEVKAKAKGFTWGWGERTPPEKEYVALMEKIYPGYRERYIIKKYTKRAKKTGQSDMFLCHGCTANAELSKIKCEVNK